MSHGPPVGDPGQLDAAKREERRKGGKAATADHGRAGFPKRVVDTGKSPGQARHNNERKHGDADNTIDQHRISRGGPSRAAPGQEPDARRVATYGRWQSLAEERTNQAVTERVGR